MKVPKIGPGGITVITPDNRAGDVVSIFYPEQEFLVDCSGEGIVLPFKDYNPAGTMKNFLRAIVEWDYHYRASDDPRLYEEGKEYEQALIELFKTLPERDKQSCRKIVEIVVMSTMPT